MWTNINGKPPHNLPPSSKQIVVITIDERAYVGHCSFDDKSGEKIFIEQLFGDVFTMDKLSFWAYSPINSLAKFINEK